MTEPSLLTIEDVARYLNISVKTLYARVDSIPHYKIGRLLRFKKEDIDRWIESNRVDGDTVHRRIPRARKPRDNDVHSLVRRTIDEVKGIRYIPRSGKSDHFKSLGKEE